MPVIQMKRMTPKQRKRAAMDARNERKKARQADQDFDKYFGAADSANKTIAWRRAVKLPVPTTQEVEKLARDGFLKRTPLTTVEQLREVLAELRPAYQGHFLVGTIPACARGALRSARCRHPPTGFPR